MLSAMLSPSASPSPLAVLAEHADALPPAIVRRRRRPSTRRRVIAPLRHRLEPKIARSSRCGPRRAGRRCRGSRRGAASASRRARRASCRRRSQQRLARRPRAARIQLVERRARPSARRCPAATRRRCARRRRCAVAQHDEAVGDRLHFFEEVRDVDDRRCPRAFSRRDQRRRARCTSACAEAARRLVEDEHAAADRERARDLDELLRRRRQNRRRRPRARSRRGRARASAPAAVARIAIALHDGRGAPAPCRARCSPSRRGAARATAPGRSSRRRRGARRADRAARRARRRAASRRRRARARPARIAISVLLPAPFWPTSAQTSPRAHREVDAVERDRRAERLRDAAHLEARRSSYGFSHFERSGCSSSFAVGIVHVVARRPAATPVSIALLDLLPSKVRDHRLHAEVAHVAPGPAGRARRCGRRSGPSPACRTRRSRRTSPCRPTRCPAARAASRSDVDSFGVKMPSTRERCRRASCSG